MLGAAYVMEGYGVPDTVEQVTRVTTTKVDFAGSSPAKCMLVYTRRDVFLCIELTSRGKRESVSSRYSIEIDDQSGVLNPLRDKNECTYRGVVQTACPEAEKK